MQVGTRPHSLAGKIRTVFRDRDLFRFMEILGTFCWPCGLAETEIDIGKNGWKNESECCVHVMLKLTGGGGL